MRIYLRQQVRCLLSLFLVIIFIGFYLRILPYDSLQDLDYNYSVVSWVHEKPDFENMPEVKYEHKHNKSVMISNSVFLYGCYNIHQIELGKSLGHGVTKKAFYGTHGSRRVVVKMVTPDSADVTACLKTAVVGKEKDCYHFPLMKLMKEILMLQQLRHPAILRLLGYCVRSEEMKMTSLERHGLVAVYEYGNSIHAKVFASWSLERRLQVAMDLADLFIYLENHPLGSLIFPDFKLDHFILVDDKIKLIDIDDVSAIEETCDILGPQMCSFNLTCRDSVCKGSNAKYNMHHFGKLFTDRLFTVDDTYKYPEIGLVRQKLKDTSMTAQQLKEAVEKIMTRLKGFQ